MSLARATHTEESQVISYRPRCGGAGLRGGRARGVKTDTEIELPPTRVVVRQRAADRLTCRRRSLGDPLRAAAEQSAE